MWACLLAAAVAEWSVSAHLSRQMATPLGLAGQGTPGLLVVGYAPMYKGHALPPCLYSGREQTENALEASACVSGGPHRSRGL